DIQYLPFYIRETHQQFQRNGIEPKFFVSEFLEIPTVVAGTDLLGPFVSSMGPTIEKQLGLRLLASPLELPAVPIYMVWHEARRQDAAHRWLRELVAKELARFVNADPIDAAVE